MIDGYEVDFVVERPDDQRIWVVRASGGAYVGHFSTHSVIAIAHVDSIRLPEGPINEFQLSSIQDSLQRRDPDRARSSITSHVNQVRTFVSTMKIDDLVVTLNSSRVRIGRISGEAYIDHTPLEITSDGSTYSMRHNLRRSVEWGPRIARSAVPAALELTMLAHQTVFNIDDYWESIYHLIYPCFYANGKLYLSANIKQTRALDNYSVSQFFALLSGIEILAKDFDTHAGAIENYPALTDNQFSRLDLTLTSKAEFMSPGAIWAALSGGGAALLWAAVIYLMVFGGDIKIFKTDGLLDLKTRQKLWNIAIKLIETHSMKRVQQRLKMDVPHEDTSKLIPKKPARKRAAPKGKIQLEQKDDEL